MAGADLDFAQAGVAIGGRGEGQLALLIGSLDVPGDPHFKGMRVDHHESVGTEIERANGSVLVLRRRDEDAVGGRGRRAFMVARD
jgi:hypothetical protein